MNQQELFIKYNGKFLDFDGGFGPQCVDVIKAYFVEVLGISPIAGNAIDYWRDIPGFTRIKNSVFSYPKPGDIIIWDTGEFGHIAVCNWSRIFDIGVFEQNNPIGSPCHFGEYNYRSILGWQRPNVQPKEWKVLYAGNHPDMSSFEASVSSFTKDLLSIKSKSVPNQIQVSVGMPTSEQCWAFLDTLDTSNVRSVFIFYPPNSTSTFFSASYYPKKNITYVTCPLPGDTNTYTHEFLHLFRKWTNSNHIGFIEDVEYYPPNWRFEEQYKQILTVLNKL